MQDLSSGVSVLCRQRRNAFHKLALTLVYCKMIFSFDSLQHRSKLAKECVCFQRKRGFIRAFDKLLFARGATRPLATTE